MHLRQQVPVGCMAQQTSRATVKGKEGRENGYSTCPVSVSHSLTTLS